MFNNIGGKMKGLAVFIAVGGIVSALISGLVLASTFNVFLGIVIIIEGSLISWIGSWSIYAIGHIADNTEDLLVAVNKPEEKTNIFMNVSERGTDPVQKPKPAATKYTGSGNEIMPIPGSAKEENCSVCGTYSIISKYIIATKDGGKTTQYICENCVYSMKQRGCTSDNSVAYDILRR